MQKTKSNTKRVAIIAYPNLTTFEFGCAIELFSLERLEIPKCYETDVIATQEEPITAVGGFSIQTAHALSANAKDDFFSDYDMVIIPGWTWDKPQASDELLNALRYFYHKGGTLVSFCAGAFVLAQTGLLDNKSATTHWLFTDEFKQKFPKVHLKENVLYTEEDRLYSSAGSAAALDLGLHLIRKDFGANIANIIAKRLVLSPQRDGGQAQYATAPSHPQKPNHLSKSLQWANDNLHTHITIDEMAQHACLSRRSFDRHFRNSLGQSPKEWLIQQRINLAREFLESSQANMEQIAVKSGFGSSMNLRHHFSQVLGVTPTHYRNQFMQT